MAREIIRAKHRQHAMRAVTQGRRAVGHIRALLAGAGVVGLHRNGDFVDHRRDFGRRFPARFTGFAGDNAGQLDFVGFQQRRKFLNHRLTQAKRLFRPRRECGTRRFTRLLNLCGAGIGSGPQRFFTYRIGFLAAFAFARHPVAINP
ncbi:hypothetical protein D3C85_1320120 [compost metagenome]